MNRRRPEWEEIRAYRAVIVTAALAEPSTETTSGTWLPPKDCVTANWICRAAVDAAWPAGAAAI